jgi:predicted protein tyrosine phosphatase
MSKQILAESAVGASRFTAHVPWACISIASQEGSWPEISAVNRLGLLQLAFGDVNSFECPKSDEGFAEEHAHAILDFVREQWDLVELLLVHCEVGRCRGPAVAAAVSKIYLGHDDHFFLPDLYQPNPLVYKTMMNVAVKRGEFAGQRIAP